MINLAPDLFENMTVIFMDITKCSCVIGHGIGGKHIPIMARLAKGQTLE